MLKVLWFVSFIRIIGFDGGWMMSHKPSERANGRTGQGEQFGGFNALPVSRVWKDPNSAQNYLDKPWQAYYH